MARRAKVAAARKKGRKPRARRLERLAGSDREISDKV